MITPELFNALNRVEEAHFRTTSDTGANSCAMVVWNSLRRALGLPAISISDLKTYNIDTHLYETPIDSKLMNNLKYRDLL